MEDEWEEWTLELRVRKDAYTPGGISRDEPENIHELLELIDLLINQSDACCGKVQIKIL